MSMSDFNQQHIILNTFTNQDSSNTLSMKSSALGKAFVIILHYLPWRVLWPRLHSLVTCQKVETIPTWLWTKRGNFRGISTKWQKCNRVHYKTTKQHITLSCLHNSLMKQEAQKCPKRRVAQAAIRLATAVIKFRNKERNVRSPS